MRRKCQYASVKLQVSQATSKIQNQNLNPSIQIAAFSHRGHQEKSPQYPAKSFSSSLISGVASCHCFPNCCAWAQGRQRLPGSHRPGPPQQRRQRLHSVLPQLQSAATGRPSQGTEVGDHNWGLGISINMCPSPTRGWQPTSLIVIVDDGATIANKVNYTNKTIEP